MSANEQYAWLEKIENGTLVHYAIVVKHRMKNPAASLMQISGVSAEEEFIETCALGRRTVYCKDLDEVCAAIRHAAAAQEEIDKLKRDGKLSVQHNLMSFLGSLKGMM
jgi:hypothetical protein